MHEGKVADVWVSRMAPLRSAVGPHPRYCRKALASRDAVRGDGYFLRPTMGRMGEVLKGNKETSELARFGPLNSE